MRNLGTLFARSTRQRYAPDWSYTAGLILAGWVVLGMVWLLITGEDSADAGVAQDSPADELLFPVDDDPDLLVTSSTDENPAVVDEDAGVDLAVMGAVAHYTGDWSEVPTMPYTTKTVRDPTVPNVEVVRTETLAVEDDGKTLTVRVLLNPAGPDGPSAVIESRTVVVVFDDGSWKVSGVAGA